MYDRAETAQANDRLWAGIRDALRAGGGDAPQILTRGEGAYWPAWQDPALVFSQTCGYPYRAILHEKVTLIGTPDYGLPGCPPGHYNSVFIARKDDPRQDLIAFRDAAFAFNEALSQSGWAAPQNHAAAMGFHFAPTLMSGGHRLSALAVAEGRADIAAIDALTWEMLQRWEGWCEGLREVARTGPTPALPFIAAKGADGQALFAATKAAIAGLSAQDRETLHLRDVVRIGSDAYLGVPSPPGPAQIAQPR
jgi:ABC-type phosphate/phosphonate transport system substrate-binding protein